MTCVDGFLPLYGRYQRRLVALFLIAALVFPTSSMSRTWRVTPDGLGDAPTIQAAVDSSAAGDSILVAQGTFHENVVLEPARILVGSWDATFSESGLEVFTTIIDGDSLSSCIQADFGGVEDAVGLVEGFLLRHGAGTLVSGTRRGGGIYSVGLQRLKRCTLEENIADEGGGAYMSGNNPLIDNVKVYGNAGNYGGGAYVHGAVQSTIRNSIVQGNGYAYQLALAFAGAGLYLTGKSCLVDSVECVGNYGPAYANDVAGAGIYSVCASLTVRNSRITDNQSEPGSGAFLAGGGIYAQNLVAMNTTISRNKCIYGAGGGIYAGTCLLIDCEITDNLANGGEGFGSGGGVVALEAAEVVRCLIRGNWCAGLVTAVGGGIYANALTIRNSIVAGNTLSEVSAPTRGAGIYAQSLDAANLVVSGNSFNTVDIPGAGGGIFIGEMGSGTIRSSIFSFNGPYGTNGGVIVGNVQSISNLFFDNYSVLFAGGTVDSSGHIHADPLVANVADGDYHLLLNSPAIDQGDPADFDPDGSRADIGAFGGHHAIMRQPVRVEGAQGASGYTLHWTAVTSHDLAGYAIYRADAPGIHPGLETLLDLPQGLGTTFVDRFAIPNKTYFYRVSAYNSSRYGGGYSDEVALTAIAGLGESGGDRGGNATDITTGLPPKVDQFSLKIRGANPCRGRVELELALPQAGQVELSVYEISGRRVWSEVQSLEAGYREIHWEGIHQDGSQAATGVYLVQALAAGKASTQRVVLLR